MGLTPQTLYPRYDINASRFSAFSKHLRFHLHRQYGSALIGMIRYGANIGYCGPDMARSTLNAATAREHADISRASITKEVTLGHAVGPFEYPPFPNSGLVLLVYEKEEWGHRIIMDLSRPLE